jgi:dsDNA-specific endonuclease/ATPase MutS2
MPTLRAINLKRRAAGGSRVAGSAAAVTFMTLLEWLKRWRAGHTHVQEEVSEPIENGDEAEVDPFNPFPEPIAIEITDVIDLHTISPKEVRAVVEEYLREARRRGFRSVRIIHGKGAGVQREIVRGVLQRTPFVRDWADAPPAAGGWGATVAHFSPEEE